MLQVAGPLLQMIALLGQMMGLLVQLIALLRQVVDRWYTSAHCCQHLIALDRHVIVARGRVLEGCSRFGLVPCHLLRSAHHAGRASTPARQRDRRGLHA